MVLEPGRMLVLELWLYWTMWIGYDAILPGTSLRLGCLGLAVQVRMPIIYIAPVALTCWVWW